MGRGRKEKEDYFESVTLRGGDRAGRWAVASLDPGGGADATADRQKRCRAENDFSAGASPPVPHPSFLPRNKRGNTAEYVFRKLEPRSSR